MANFEIPERSQRLETMLDCANIGLWEIMIEGSKYTIHMDERASVLCGFPREEITMDCSELLGLYHQDDLPRIQEMLHYLIFNPETKGMIEYRVWNKKEKKWRWSRSFGVCRKTDRPGCYCVLGSTIDFQDSPVIQSLTEQTREANERSQIMLDELPMCCNFWSAEHSIVDCNEGSLKLFGMRSKREYLDNYYSLMPERQPCGRLSRELVIEKIQEAFDRGRTAFEWLYIRPDGVMIPVEVTLVRVRYGEGYIVVEYTRDLREHHKMMREIENHDKVLQTLNHIATILLKSEVNAFESDMWKCMGMMADFAEADRVYIWKNHEKDGQLFCTQLYEWYEGIEPTMGNDITIDIPYSSFIMDDTSLDKALSNGRSINGIVRNMSQAAREQLSPQGVLSILIVPLFLHDQFWGFIGFDNCHSERVFSEMEESLLDSAGLLIAHALSKNEMTLNLQIKENEAKAASIAKSNFLSNMSHEIRTPMNAIIGMTSIGKAAHDTERKDYAFSKIEDASKHMLGVINDILDMSKIEANKFELLETEFSIEKVLDQVVNVVSHRTEEKRQQLSIRIDRDVPSLLVGDDQRLAQVTLNLLSNAIKFTPEMGSIHLHVSPEGQDDGVYTIRFEISDTGIGISQEQQERLFEAFLQAENNTTRKFGGTGLGLAISKNIIEMMGGKIWLKSEIGKGSTFSFNIRLKKVGDSGGKNSQCTDNHGDVFSREDALKGYSILLVEDIEINREIVMATLESTGAQIECAENGEKAVGMFKNDPKKYDLIFMDVQMPVMDGFEATRAIRAMTDIPEAGQIPIVAMTASAFKEDIDKCLEMGMNDHIAKPLDMEKVFSKMLAYLHPK